METKREMNKSKPRGSNVENNNQHKTTQTNGTHQHNAWDWQSDKHAKAKRKYDQRRKAMDYEARGRNQMFTQVNEHKYATNGGNEDERTRAEIVVRKQGANKRKSLKNNKTHSK